LLTEQQAEAQNKKEKKRGSELVSDRVGIVKGSGKLNQDVICIYCKGSFQIMLVESSGYRIGAMKNLWGGHRGMNSHMIIACRGKWF
jgi:hypothetical protein